MATGDSIADAGLAMEAAVAAAKPSGAKLAELREPPTNPVYLMDPDIETEIVFDPDAAAQYATKLGAAVLRLAEHGVLCREVTLSPSDGTVHFRFDFDHHKFS